MAPNCSASPRRLSGTCLPAEVRVSTECVDQSSGSRPRLASTASAAAAASLMSSQAGMA